MNKTQKGAWFNLTGSLLCIAVILWVIIRLGIMKTMPEGWERFWPAIVFMTFTVPSIVFLRKKQSPTEVDFDERDNHIKYRAGTVSFISVWVMLAVLCLVCFAVVGVSGSVPVWLLVLGGVGVFNLSLAIYSTAIIMQYSRGAKHGRI